jgi:hypothetical protein
MCWEINPVDSGNCIISIPKEGVDIVVAVQTFSFFEVVSPLHPE